ncbi:hypothetical protein NQ318_008519 [Aromia moschata]|uniref:Uncharacterized protein n=1 Tax=Aromia moschata TaxID=1265417 RepID=A0AAV8XEF1_9CUCU|nr:hypothetical protein NQ318_008519 [Aromia moschata]
MKQSPVIVTGRSVGPQERGLILNTILKRRLCISEETCLKLVESHLKENYPSDDAFNSFNIKTLSTCKQQYPYKHNKSVYIRDA